MIVKIINSKVIIPRLKLFKLFNICINSMLLKISKLVIIPIIKASMTMQRKSIILPLFAPNL